MKSFPFLIDSFVGVKVSKIDDKISRSWLERAGPW